MKSLIVGLLCLVPSAALALELPVHGTYCGGMGTPYKAIISRDGFELDYPGHATIPCYPVAVDGQHVIAKCYNDDGSVETSRRLTLIESPDHKTLIWSSGDQKMTLEACGEDEENGGDE